MVIGSRPPGSRRSRRSTGFEPTAPRPRGPPVRSRAVLLTLTTTHRPATDLGFLLHKHPDRVQAFSVPFGQAHVLYPEATEERCAAALVLDVDPVDPRL